MLILNSYHKEFQWTDDQVSAAQEVLSTALEDLELYVEYMDTKRVFNEPYLELLRETYRLKYADVKLDAIIATDDNALSFLLQNNEELFGDRPVVFCGINDFSDTRLQGRDNYTGLVEVLDIQQTIDLALKLHPRTRRVVVVVDDTPTGMGQRKSVASVALQFENLEFDYLQGEDLTHGELGETLGELPADTIVLLTVWLRDKTGTYLSTREGGKLISSNSTVPVYGIIDMFLGHGIVGGKLLNSRTHGRTAGEMVLRILDGTPPADIPVQQHSTNPYMFDHRQLERWAIDASALPKNSIVVNRPVSFYAMYWKWIWGVIAAFVALIALIMVLSRNNLRRRRAESRYRDLVETTSDWVWAVDRKGTFTYSNDRVRALLGYEPEEVLGRPAFDFMTPEEASRTRVLLQELVASKNPATALENTYLHKDGRPVVMETSGVPILDSAGKLLGYRGIDRDITQRKQAEREREKLVGELEAQNAELERFTYTVSHDLRSPLITIQGYVGMLREDLAKGDVEPAQNDLARISNAADRMDQLLRDVLELSRIGHLINEPDDVSLEELAREALELVGGQVNQRGVQVEISPDLPVVFGDRSRLREVLQNLIDNAVKYMGDQPRPRVEIGSRRDGNETIYYVRDNGIGIDPRYNEKIFGLFEQLNPKVEGSGIGLSLVRRIVEVHGGRIWVESEGSGHGSTFCFTIAARDESAALETMPTEGQSLLKFTSGGK